MARTGLGLPLQPGMRVGLFGGSFDPPHEGHLHVARTGLRRGGLDRVVWLVSPGNPLKPAPADLARRMALVGRLATGPGMIVSDAEARLGVRYSIDAVRALKRRYRGVRFVWLMGSDAFGGLHRWRRWTRFMAEVPILVVARPGADLRVATSPAGLRFAAARRPASEAPRLALRPAPAWSLLPGRWNYASSTALRSRYA